MEEIKIINEYEKYSEHYDEFYKKIAKNSRINLNEFKCKKMARYAIITMKFTHAFDSIDFNNITLDEYIDFIKYIDKNIRNIYTQQDFFYNVDKRQWSNGQNYKIERALSISFMKLLNSTKITVENIEKWKKIYFEKYSSEFIEKINTFQTIKESNIKLF